MATGNTALAHMTGDDPVTALHAANDTCLEELEHFLSTINANDYRDNHRSESAIGAHVRHLLEHYEILIRDLGHPIDYERRAREPDVERCPRAARLRVRSVRGDLREVAARWPDTMLPVWCTASDDAGQGVLAVRSSLARELLFLHSHTVHHMALIAVLGRQRGLVVDQGFGVAPSTLRQRR